MKRYLILIFSVVLLTQSIPAFADRGLNVSQQTNDSERRYALVIGNAEYKTGPLRNPVHDANDMAAILKQKGFEVDVLTNASRRDIAKSIRRLGNQLKKGGVGLFFYAGHGMQVNGRNYLIPVGADIQVEEDIQFESVDANRVLVMMQSAGNRLNMVFLDACRDNPFARSFRSGAKGLATMDAPGGTLVAFATAPGRTAADGTGRNGLFTGHLIKHMNTPGLPLTKMMMEVRKDVLRDSDEKQTPWDVSSLTGDFYFTGDQGTQVATRKTQSLPQKAPVTINAEEEFWKEIEDSKNPREFQDYLDAYPAGRFVHLAKLKIRRLEKDSEAGKSSSLPIENQELNKTSIISGKSVAVVFDAGGKNDRSFNQSTWEGATKARDEFNIPLKYSECQNSRAVEEAMRTFASEDYGLIIGIGFANASAIRKVAKDYPKINFAIVDAVVDLPNVSNLLFKEHEGSYLVGMLAAMRSRLVNGRRAVGFIGGMRIPLLQKFEVGFQEGARRIYPDIDVIVNYVGNTPIAWNNPAKGKSIAKTQIRNGASVIYAVAGGSGNGLFDALKEVNGRGPCYPKVVKGNRIDQCVYGIGVDSNQNYIVPGQILTSMLKRVDVAVYDVIRKYVHDSIRGGVYVFGIENDGVGYALDKYNSPELINKKMVQVLTLFKKKITNGEVVVPSRK